MELLEIKLANFRNFPNKSFKFSPNINIILGKNASGKTNVLESAFLLATGKSFKAKVEGEMVNYEAEVTRVTGSVSGSQNVEGSKENEGSKKHSTSYRLHSTDLEVVLTHGQIAVSESPEKIQKVARKKLSVNGVGKRLVDFAGKLEVVLFAPQDLSLVTESPSIRRKFLDTVLSQVDREYRRCVLSYEKGLRQRNKLLWRIREEGVPRSQLVFWNKLLIKNGDYVSGKREEFIDFVNTQGEIDLSGSKFRLDYDKSAISESRLEQYAREEVAAGTTLVGPHRDDFVFKVEDPVGRDLARYGSRGEQRMGVLWLKMAELAYVTKSTGENPILLLDDIFSELDHGHRDIVMEVVTKQQTIITTADPHFIVDFKDAEVIKL